jgi:hypothetical protein
MCPGLFEVKDALWSVKSENMFTDSACGSDCHAVPFV